MIALRTLSVGDAGTDGVLLHCGTDVDRRCELFSSADLTSLAQHRRLEHDEGLQSIVANSLNSDDVCVVVVTPQTTLVPL